MVGSHEDVEKGVGIGSNKPTQLGMSSDSDNQDTPAPRISLGAEESAVSVVRVLNVGGPAREVARQLGLELQDNLPLPGDQSVVVVVSEPSEVDALLEAENCSWVGCIIAWHLPESSIERLFQLGVTVFVGLPLVKDVITAIEYLPDENALGDARSLSARLATIETLLADI
jgi:hypothetical protein